MEQTLYLFPETLDEAIKLYGNSKINSKLLGGGTAISRLFKKTGKFPDRIIDLKNCSLNKILKKDENLQIGACATIGDLLESQLVKDYMNGIFMELLPNIASTQLRNLITVGGNIIQVFPWSDLPVLCLLLDAEVFYINSESKDSIHYEALIKSNPSSSFGKKNIVTHICFKKHDPCVQASVIKFSRTAFDYSITTCGTSFGVKDGRIYDPVIVIGGSIPLPVRAISAESLLNGKEPDPNNFLEVAKLAAENINFSNVNGISSEYRRELTISLLKKCFIKTLSKISKARTDS